MVNTIDVLKLYQNSIPERPRLSEESKNKTRSKESRDRNKKRKSNKKHKSQHSKGR